MGNLLKGCPRFSPHQCDNVFDLPESRPLRQSLPQRLSWENSSSRQLKFHPSPSLSLPQIPPPHTHTYFSIFVGTLYIIYYLTPYPNAKHPV